ncbi:MAG: YkgJ family cysteine cluster protein [Methanobacteriota archaeon]
MSINPDFQALCSDIEKIAFTCKRCGTCCRETEPGSNVVMVGPGEVRPIMVKTGLTFDEVAEPYPDTIREDDKEYTLAWAIRREEGRCRFFKDGCCSIYDVRPWICRTYPFMLENGSIAISSCNGVRLGQSQSAELTQVRQLVTDLLDRQKAEEEEEERIVKVIGSVKIPAGQFVVIDGEGMRIIHG